MSWIVVGVAGASAALGAANAASQRKAQQNANQQNADISAAQMQYSPWTGVKPQNAQMGAVGGSTLGGAAQGALGGAMFGSTLKDKLMAPGANPVATNTDPNGQPLGNYAGQLGQMFKK